MKRQSPASFDRLEDAALATSPPCRHKLQVTRDAIKGGPGSSVASRMHLDQHLHEHSDDESSENCETNCMCASLISLYSSGSKKPRRRVPTGSDSAETDALVAREMNQLSLQERERIFEDIHGVGDTEVKEFMEKENDTAFVDRCLHHLEDEISRIRRGTAYERALWMNPSYVKSRKFRLMFLRCERWDSRKAGRRLVQHLENKLELFGLKNLVKDITFDDLDEDDRETLYAGAIHLLPVKDRAGRSVFVSVQKFFKFKTWKNQARVWFYCAMVNLESIDAQRRGVVSLIYNLDSGDIKLAERNMTEMIIKCSSLMHTLPARFVSTHFAFDASNLRYVMSLTQKMIGTENRVRFRAHYGTHLECQYALMSFGIDTSAHAFPIDTQGNLRPGFVESFVEKRRAIEAKHALEEENRLNPQETSGIRPRLIPYPNPDADIVLGRGKPFQKWPGNLRLIEVIEAERARHQAANRNGKTAICLEIVETVHKYGGRFLKRDETSEMWVEVDDTAAREKCSHSFRSKAKKAEKTAMGAAVFQTQAQSPFPSFDKNLGKIESAENGSSGFGNSAPINFEASLSSLFSSASKSAEKDNASIGSINRGIFNMNQGGTTSQNGGGLSTSNTRSNGGGFFNFFHHVNGAISITHDGDGAVNAMRRDGNDIGTT